MSKILNAARDGDHFVLTVQLGGYKEKWTYERDVSDTGLISYIMIDREDTK